MPRCPGCMLEWTLQRRSLSIVGVVYVYVTHWKGKQYRLIIRWNRDAPPGDMAHVSLDTPTGGESVSRTLGWFQGITSLDKAKRVIFPWAEAQIISELERLGRSLR